MKKIFDRTLMLSMVTLTVLQIIFSNQLVRHAREVDILDKSRRELSDENELLRQHVAAKSSLQTIETKAFALGLVKAGKFITINSDTFSVALKDK